MILRDFRLQKGSSDKPTVVLIHGFGMSGHFWEHPEACLVLGGLAPLSAFLADQPPSSRKKAISQGLLLAEQPGMAERLARDGFSVVSWSQSAPLGSVTLAVNELAEVVRRVKEMLPGPPLWLICHSRGGLIARYFILSRPSVEVAGCITLGTPHHGTELASLSRYLRPVGNFLQKIFKAPDRESRIGGALQRIGNFLSSEAIVELKPGSGLLASLEKPIPSQIALFSSGGTNPDLFSFYFRTTEGWKRLVFPDFFLRLLPNKKIPFELMAGAGDGLVSAASARLADAEHRDYDLNHVQLAFDSDVYQWVRSILAGEGR